MRGVLETYETLISKMLKELPTPLPDTTGSKGGVGEGGAGEDVRTELNYILQKVLELKKNQYKEHDNLLSSLMKLISIKVKKETNMCICMDNLTVDLNQNVLN